MLARERRRDRGRTLLDPRGARRAPAHSAGVHRVCRRRLRRREPRTARTAPELRASSSRPMAGTGDDPDPPAGLGQGRLGAPVRRRRRRRRARGAMHRCARRRTHRDAVRRCHPPGDDDHRPPRRREMSPRSISRGSCTRRPRSAVAPRADALTRPARPRSPAARSLRRPVRLGRRRRRRRVRRRAAVRADSTARPRRLHAGAGIVAGSEADAEWAETQAKLEPMLRALVRP